MKRLQKYIAKLLIPKGYYCKGCPFWFIDKTQPETESGYCSYLGKGDWDINEEQGLVEVTTYNEDQSIKSVTMEDAHIYQVSMLWDGIKGCG